MAKTVKPSLNTEIIKRSIVSKRVERKTGNKAIQQHSIAILLRYIELRRSFCAKYKLLNSSFEVMVKITYRWVIEGKGSTVYIISKDNKFTTTSNGVAIRGMYEKGMLEVIGRGSKGAKMYAPTYEVIKMLDDVTQYGIAV